MKIQHFKQAPLPFIGQKRRFLNDFKHILNQHTQNQCASVLQQDRAI